VFSPWSVPEKKARKWIWIGLAGVAALQLYYVQEMIAAFVVLGVVFALIAGAGMLVFLVDRASGRTLTWAEMSRILLHTARRGVHFAGALAAKRAAERGAQVSLLNKTQLRHPRLGTAR
jgi:NO-binding membrane sensor protein with MHYT domain